jgi:SPP1 family predicted phage head-tail adaptor
MEAGKLRHRVKLQKGTDVRDAFGEPTIAWSTVDTYWANVVGLSGRELWRAQQVSADVTDEVTLRFNPRIASAKMRFLYGARALNIQAVLDKDGRRRQMNCLCVEAIDTSSSASTKSWCNQLGTSASHPPVLVAGPIPPLPPP